MELGGLTAGTQYDQLNILGNAYLDGALEISLLNGFAPSLGNEFKILNFDRAQGYFASFVWPSLGEGLAWDTSRLYTEGTIGVVTPEPVSAMLAALAVGLGVGMRRAKRPG
jgi:hypothetical protein